MGDVSTRENGRPLSEVLPVTSSAEVLDRTWRRIEATRHRRRRTRQFAAVIAPALAAALVLYVWPRARVDVAAATTAQPAIASSPNTASVVHLSATSSFSMAADAGVTIVAQTPTDVQLALERGRVQVTVDPAERRRWTVSVRPEPRDGWRCEPVDVEVLGTVFEVERTADSVNVAVDRGVVAVRGPGFRHRLEAAQKVTVPLACTSALELIADKANSNEESADAAPPTSEAAMAPTGPSVEPSSELSEDSGDVSLPETAAPYAEGQALPALDEVPSPRPPATPSKTPPTRSKRPVPLESGIGTPSSASPELPPTGEVASSPASPAPFADVMAEADAHRRGGRLREAIELLEALLRERDHEPGAGIAAYTLATLRDDVGETAAAASAFDRASRLGLPDALRAAAVARAFDAWSRAGDRERATRGAADYLQRYPTGDAVDAARAVLR